MIGRTYLDWNATARLRPEAREAAVAALSVCGNASSVHYEGRGARQRIEQARAEVAVLVGADPRNVIFTSGATEANALALTPQLQAAGDTRPRDRLFVSAIEHASVLHGGRFPADRVDMLAVTPDGVVDLDALERRLAVLPGGSRPLVAVMAANNETGVLQPVRAVAELVHAAGGLLHVDAVQMLGRTSLDINDIGADLMSVSGHKIGAPQGVGALVRRNENLHFPEPLIRGGGQEGGVRGGTENLAGIAGFGAAARALREQLAVECSRMAKLQQRLEAGLHAIAPDTIVFGVRVERVPNTSAFAVRGLRAETALIMLDLDGVSVSSGSACSSGKVSPSHVLAAMRVDPELARGAIRVSWGHSTTEAEIDRFLEAWTIAVRSLSKGRQGIAA